MVRGAFVGSASMTRDHLVDRRRFGQRLAAFAAVGAAVAPGLAWAQRPVTPADWKVLEGLSKEARALGLSVSPISIPTEGDAKFGQLLRSLVDFIDDLDDPVPVGATATPAAVASIKTRASDLLSKINSRERSPKQSDLGTSRWLAFLSMSTPAFAEPSEERYRRHKASYISLFETAKVNPDRKSDVDWHVETILKPKNRARYVALEDQVCVPWYFIGLVHMLEASFNFDGHLHNGDSLQRRTVNVPVGYPKTGSPPFDWAYSGKDALDYEKASNQPDWSLARMLCRLEGYNGFRSREEHNINSPYLWSFSNHYTRGKFTADDYFDPTAVSKQCGGAIVLRELFNRGVIQIVV
jgi:lysozyme family protein